MSADNPMDIYTNQLREDITQHIEEFACAFAKHTQLPPDKIVMCHIVEWRKEGMVNKIWFEENRMAIMPCPHCGTEQIEMVGCPNFACPGRVKDAP